MADNVSVTAGVGTSIATDDVGGVQYQRVKLDGGGDGVAVPIIAGHGLAAAALLVELPTDGTGNVANVGTIGTSVTPGGGAAHLGKAEDGAHTSGDTGVMALVVRNDTLAVLAAHDHDYAPLQVNAAGALYVDMVAVGVAAGDLAKAEDAAHTSGDVGVMALAVRQDTAASLGATDADYSPLITDSTGKLHVNVGAVTPGTGATNLGKIEDAGHTTGDVGVMALAVRNDAGSVLAATTADYIPLSTDATGRLYTNSKTAGSVFTITHLQSTVPDADPQVDASAAPTGTMKIVLMELFVYSTDAVMVEIREESAATIFFKFYAAALSNNHFVFENGIKVTTADKKLQVYTSGAHALEINTWVRSEA